MTNIINGCFGLNLDFLKTSGHSSGNRYAFIVVALILGLLVLQELINGVIFNWVLGLARKARNQILIKMLQAFHKPVRVLVILIGFYIIMRFLPLSIQADAIFLIIFRSLLIIIISWGFYRFCDAESLISDEFKDKMSVDPILVPMLSKVLRFIIVALAIVLVAKEWGFDVNGFVAGLGLGGLALALAAKDMLANIFAGIVILMEKPFTIGERISSGKAQGIVEDISFRSTKIRAADQSLITVPNSLLGNEAIVNLSRMERRKVAFYIGLAPDTEGTKVQVIIEKLRDLLRSHPGLQPDTSNVVFDSFNANSLDILVTYYTVTTSGDELQNIKQDINLKLRDIIAGEGTALAVPTQNA